MWRNMGDILRAVSPEISGVGLRIIGRDPVQTEASRIREGDDLWKKLAVILIGAERKTACWCGVERQVQERPESGANRRGDFKPSMFSSTG